MACTGRSKVFVVARAVKRNLRMLGCSVLLASRAWAVDAPEGPAETPSRAADTPSRAAEGPVWPVDDPMCSDAIEVVSLNAWGLPGIFAPHRRERMPRIARWLNAVDADVVALQELWSGAAPLLPLQVHRSVVRGDDGLALRGRAPLTGREDLRYAEARGFDALKKKGALRARVPTHNGPDLWVVVTHLQSGFGRANAHVREAQLEQLIAWTADLDGPVLFIGDFNIDDRLPEDVPAFERLRAAGLVDLADDFGATESTYPGDGNRYDRILARSGGGWEVVTDAVVVVMYDDDPETAAPARFSDHRPIRARLHLQRLAQAP